MERATARGLRAAAGYPPQAAPATAPNFNGDYYPAHPAYPQEAPQFAPPPIARQPYANPGYGGGDPYHADHEAGGYADPRSGGHPGGYEGGPYYPNRMHPGDDVDDAYDDAPPARRRMGIMAIAAVFALAVIGTAGAFGYRALFGSSGVERAAAGDQGRCQPEQDRAGGQDQGTAKQQDDLRPRQ